MLNITGGNVAISGVTISNGNTPSNGGGILNIGTLNLTDTAVSNNNGTIGGGIRNNGAMTLTNSTVSGSTASNNGGGIANSGTLTLANSIVSGSTTSGNGSGIYNFSSGILTLTNSTITGNSAEGGHGGGITNTGTMTIANTTVSGNSTPGSVRKGGGIYNNGGPLNITNSTVSGNTAVQGGGGIYNIGTVTITDSTVSGNKAETSSGAGGIFNDSGTVTLTNSTITGNSAEGGHGGGITNTGTMTIANTTVSGNSTPGSVRKGGGIYNNGGPLNITNSTVTGNSANSNGGGIHNNSGITELVNTIIAENTASSGPDCSGSPTSLGYNLIGDDTGCGFTAAPGDLVGDGANPIDPVLGPLQDNSGPTETHALLPGSPAIDAGDDGAAPATDQRGVARPQGPTSDIGAYEFEPPDVFTYSAKIVCVPHLGKASPALTPGKYRTAVNVHNPWDEPAHIQKWVTLSPPQGQTPITGGRIADTLQSWSSFDVDCPHFRDDFWLPEGAKVPGGKGFMVIRSDKKLDVVAVYTSKSKNPPSDNGVGISIDVERVEPRMSKGTIARGPIHAPSGMVSWWSGDDQPNDIVDGNHGTLQGGATYTGGMVGQAFSLDGVDAYVEVAHNPRLDPGTGNLTIDGWIKAPPGVSFRVFIGKIRSSFPFGGINFRLSDQGKLQFMVTDCGSASCGFGSSRLPVEAPFRIDDNVFHHVAGVRISTGYELYVDGQLVATRTEPARGGDTTTPLFIGIGGIFPEPTGISKPFEGLVDELEFFDRALTAAEIRAIYEAGSAGKIKPKPIPPPSGMVSWWSADNHPNDIVDSNHGTLQGGADYAQGMVDEAFSLDGVDDHIEVPDDPVFNFEGSFTIDAWVKTTDVDGVQNIVTRYECGLTCIASVSSSQFRLRLLDGKPHANVRDTDKGGDVDCGGGQCLESDTFIADGLFHHVAMVRNVEGNQLRLHVDGQLDVGEPLNQGAQGPLVDEDGDPDPLLIGAVYQGGQTLKKDFFQGLIDEVEIFDRALTDAEISAIYQAGPAGKIKPKPIPPPSGMVSWWSADNHPNDIVDSNHGTLQGGAGYAQGMVDEAFSLDGVDDHIEVPDDPVFNFEGSFTIDAWVKTTDVDGVQNIVSRNECGLTCIASVSASLSRLRLLDGKPHANVRDTDKGGDVDCGGGQCLGSATFIADGLFHHVAMVRNVEGNQLRLHVDGQLDVDEPLNQGAQGPLVDEDGDPDPLLIRAIYKGGQTLKKDFFQGLIDEVEIFDRALTAAEIRAIYEAGPAGKIKP